MSSHWLHLRPAFPRPGLPNHRATRNSGVGFVGTSGFTNWVTRRMRSAHPFNMAKISISLAVVFVPFSSKSFQLMSYKPVVISMKQASKAHLVTTSPPSRESSLPLRGPRGAGGLPLIFFDKNKGCLLAQKHCLQPSLIYF